MLMYNAYGVAVRQQSTTAQNQVKTHMAARRQGRYRVEGLEVDPRRRLCLLDGNPIPVEAQEFDLLEYLVRNPHRAIPDAELQAGILPVDGEAAIPLAQYLERIGKLLETASDGRTLLRTTESDGTPLEGAMLDAEVHFEPEIWADSAEMAVEEVAPGYAPYLSGDEDVVEGRRKLTPQERARLQRMGLILAGAAVALAAVWGAWQWTHRPRPDGVKVVLGHLRDESGASDDWLNTAVRLEMEQSPFLELETPQQVSAALNGGKFAAAITPVNATQARTACRARAADVYLSGSLRRVGAHLVLRVEARDCISDDPRGHSEGIAENADGILALLPALTGDLRRQLGETRASVERTDRPLRANGEIVAALGDYAAAERLAAGGQTKAAIVAMQKAADGGFTLAQVALNQLYTAASQPELAAASLRHAYDAKSALPTNVAYSVKTAYDEQVSEDLNAALEDAKVWGAAYRLAAQPQLAQARINLQLGQPTAALDPAWRALELDDANADAYALLAQGQLEANRVDEAAGTIRLAETHGLQEDRLHWIAYAIAVARGDDAALQAERKWADGKPEAAEMHRLDAQREFSQGKARDAEADATAAADLLRSTGMTGAADRSTAETAAIEARLGLTATASAAIKNLPDMVDNAPLALALAQTGELEKATAAMQQGLSAHPSGTLWQQVWAPEIGAAIALAENKPEAAVDALRKSAGYEMRSMEISLLRAQAYMGEKQPELAEMEYRRLLSHPYNDPLNADHMLAQLGLAQALAAEGREAEAATEFMMLEQTTLKSADSDLPALRTVRDEEAKLSAEARAAARNVVQGEGRTLPQAPGAPLRLPKPGER